MKTTIKDNYSFRKAKKKKGGRALAFVGFVVLLASFVAGTQYFAWDVGHNRLPGELFTFMGFKVYEPLMIFDWMDEWQAKRRNMDAFTDSLMIMGGCAFIGVSLIGAAVRRRNAKQDAANLYGSAQYAELDEIREAGLLPQKGEKGRGVYVGGWVNPKDGRQYYCNVLFITI